MTNDVTSGSSTPIGNIFEPKGVNARRPTPKDESGSAPPADGVQQTPPPAQVSTQLTMRVHESSSATPPSTGLDDSVRRDSVERVEGEGHKPVEAVPDVTIDFTPGDASRKGDGNSAPANNGAVSSPTVAGDTDPLPEDPVTVDDRDAEETVETVDEMVEHGDAVVVDESTGGDVDPEKRKEAEELAEQEGGAVVVIKEPPSQDNDYKTTTKIIVVEKQGLRKLLQAQVHNQVLQTLLDEVIRVSPEEHTEARRVHEADLERRTEQREIDLRYNTAKRTREQYGINIK